MLLGIIAAVQVLFLLGVVAALLIVRSKIAAVQASVKDLERDHVKPVRQLVESILADVRQVTARVEEQSARVNASVTESLNLAERQVHKVATAVHLVARETSAVASGIGAAVATLTGRLGRRTPTTVTERSSSPSSEEVWIDDSPR